MIVHLVLALVVVAFLFYVFCHSPPAKRIGDEMFYEPMEESIRKFEARLVLEGEKNNE